MNHGYVQEVSPPSGEITRLLGGLRKGDPRAWDLLIPIVYDELRRQASSYLRKERPGHVLQTTIAANLMRQILVDYARRRNAAHRGADPVMVPLEVAQVGNSSDPVPLDELDEALNRLEAIRPRHSRIVELRFFGGLTTEEAAEALGVSVRTVEREWAFAKAWLFGQLSR